ncbi:MAG: tetratricopeptide repeat protein [Pseudomonadota bacterium]
MQGRYGERRTVGTRSLISGLLVAAGVVFALPTVVHAQGVSQVYTDAFAARVATPGDTTALNAFINTAVQEGQYDQAISTIEQHLISAPRDARARLVAGRLYNHLGSWELARRHLRHALSIGTLTPEETAEAEALLARVERAIEGWTYALALSAGIRFESTDRGAAGSNDFVTGFGKVQGHVRQDLKNATRDAIIYAGSLVATERVNDVDTSRIAGQDTLIDGEASITYDKGLPNSGIETLRMLVSAFAAVETFGSSTDETAFGTAIRFTARPTVDGLAFIGAGYANLEASDGIFTDNRFNWEAGYTHRLPNGHAIGAAVRGSHDEGSGQSNLGHLVEGEVRYGGVFFSIPDRLVWLHEVGVAVGEKESPDLSLGPTFRLNGDYWRLSSAHDFQFAPQQTVSLDLSYTEIDYSGGINDRETFEASLYYTYTLQ